jgi:hypothetical protein
LTIQTIERTFGTQLREYAGRISGERYEVWREVLNEEFETATEVSGK